MLMDSFKGKKLNGPNDIIFKSDGWIWFSDPSFGSLGNYEGVQALIELADSIYRIDGFGGQAFLSTD